MEAEEWRRAGEIVAERMRELGMTAPQLAEKAEVHPSTVRALLRGARWPRAGTRDRIIAALDWTADGLTRRVWGGRVALKDATTEDLVRELCQRISQDHPHVREERGSSPI